MENQDQQEQSPVQVDEPKKAGEQAIAEKLSASGWGLFFIWIGISWLADFGTAVGMLGIGIITLITQMARRAFSLKLEGFWVFVGLLFVAGGFWVMFEPKVSLVPVLLIVAGLALLVSVLKGKGKAKEC